MFGLMTMREHEERLLRARDRDHETYLRLEAGHRAETAHWRAMAESLRADLADFRKREAPPIPGPEDAVVGSIEDGDAEWTPTALRERAKRSG